MFALGSHLFSGGEEEWRERKQVRRKEWRMEGGGGEGKSKEEERRTAVKKRWDVMKTSYGLGCWYY